MNELRKNISSNFLKAKFLLPLVFILIVLAFALRLQPKTPPLIETSSQTAETLPTPTPQLQIGKSFDFLIRNDQDFSQTKVVYSVENVQIRDQIALRGQTVQSSVGQKFLILNIKLKNSSDKDISLNTRDYVRLSRDNQEWSAPSIYNDPVTIAPISTLPTQLGFMVEADKQNWKLQIGDINGQKELIELNLQ